MEYRVPILEKPRRLKHGERAFFVPKKWARTHDERLLIMEFVCHRRLFGHGYQCLMPNYFDDMPKGSGVFISGLVPTKEILPHVEFPGDIDLLIIPYEGDELLISMSLAIEIKIIRATYKKQGRSPNQYGFSQAEALLRAGFPHVAVAHLIVSDQSPEHAWREILYTVVLDDEGRCADPKPIKVDTMPSDLIARSLGRLRANRRTEQIGLLASYLSEDWDGVWLPSGDGCQQNPKIDFDVMASIAKYYHCVPQRFIETRRWDP